jgi:Iap family predicted aminopeptidase
VKSLLFILALTSVPGQIRTVVTTLTSKDLDGRMAGTVEGIRAAHYVEHEFAAAGLRPAGNDGYLEFFDVGARRGANVIGAIPARDPDPASGVLVVGAHFDHLGHDRPGADDNASGVAALLEVVRRLSARHASLRRGVVFVAFDAEEVNALGSKAFIRDWTSPSRRVVAMLNLDMVGRLGDGALEVRGVGTSPDWRRLIEPALVGGPKTKLVESGYGPSDHARFYAAGIPVLYLTTGMHADHHTERDTLDKLDLAGIDRVAAAAEKIVWRVVSAPRPPRFRRVPGDADAFPTPPRERVR